MSTENFMQVHISANGQVVALSSDTLRDYIRKICQQMKVDHLDVDKVVKHVYPKLKEINTLEEVDDQIVTTTTEMITDHYDYPCIAIWILISKLHSNTHDDYLRVVEDLRNNVNRRGEKAPIVSAEFFDYVKKYQKEINSALHYERDYHISIFGYRTLEKAYLKKLSNGKIVERPQHLFMRVAISIHFRTNRLDRIIETYNLLSQGYFIHATPTLFNAGTTREQLSSCFLLGVDDDMEAIGECWKNCAIISKYAGGIGVHMTNIRTSGAYINSTQGVANGMRVIKIFNEIARYSDQGGKRAGSFAIYLEPWHGDILFFLDLKKNAGPETDRARDIFLGLMVNDIFMRRVENDEIWSLMCPSECPDLINKYGEEFTLNYERYEREGRYLKQMKARDLWFKIMESQIETGVPYIIFKDAANKKSNQINIGVINGSNLCVSGNTRILTSTGYLKIGNMINKSVEVWNGREFSKTVVRKTGSNQKLLELDFSNGSVLKCTFYHKFYVIRSGNVVKVEAGSLKVGDRLVKVRYPIIGRGMEYFRHPYTHGYYCSDDIRCSKSLRSLELYLGKNRGKECLSSTGVVMVNERKLWKLLEGPCLILEDARRKLVRYLDFESYGIVDVITGEIIVKLHRNLAKKYFVPTNYNINVKLKWLAGLLDGGGNIVEDGFSVQVISTNRKFLDNVRYMLQTMGCDPRVLLLNEKMIPSMGASWGRRILSGSVYHLLISANDVGKLMDLGLSTRLLELDKVKKVNRSHPVLVTGIYDLGEIGDTYCFTEPKRNMGIFNGVIAGQCAEILEVSNSMEYAVCLTKDAEIITEDGIRKIVDCGGKNVLAYYKSDVVLEKNQHFEEAEVIYSGKRTVYEIKTKGSKSIRATFDHPFLVLTRKYGCWGKREYRWKLVRDIDPGDQLVMPQIDTLESYKVTPENFDVEYLSAGWMVGNGWMTGLSWGVRFSSRDRHAQKMIVRQMNDWYSLARKMECGWKVELNMQLIDGIVIWRTCNINFKKLMYDKFGFVECDRSLARIDDKIKLTAPIKQASFLSGYFSTCGFVAVHKDKLIIGLTSVGEEILYDVQVMLIPFGIKSKVKKGSVGTKVLWHLIVNDARSISNFRKYIGFKLRPDKMDELEKYLERVKMLKEECKNYSKVLSIRRVGKEDVYDLSLPKSHHFMANGYIVHNCNLGSICLPKFVEFNSGPTFNYQKLFEVTRVVTRNLNNIIDINYYPVERAKISNKKNRPIGIGVQGLADVFALFKTPFDSAVARDLNKKIFETIYFGALTESMNLAKEHGPYETFVGSPLSQGKFQFDLWNLPRTKLSGMWDWNELMAKIQKYGVRNSLVTACMPTASTSQIMNNNETIEPYTENIYTRSTLAGDFYVINRHLMRDLMELGLWNSDMVDYIKYYHGSIQQIDGIPDNIKEIYRTAWEIPQKSLIEMSADRGPFIDQTQSLNIFISKPNFVKLNSCLFHGWKLGLKTGMYYLRSKSGSEANQFGIDIDKIREIEEKNKSKQVCIYRSKKTEACILCSS
ncbi:MAG: ribonucleoside-diphosphate reductase subunit alpha [Nitrososphaerota archaeon]